MRRLISAALSAALVSLCACNQAKQSAMPGGRGPGGALATSTVSAQPPASAAAAVDQPETQERVPVPVPNQRKLIRNANVTIDVDSAEAALAAIRSSTQALGGYVSNESQSQDDTLGPKASVTCRVPAEKIDALLAQVKSLGKVETATITAEDISEQYFDLQMRMRNQKQLEDRLLDLLKRPSNNLADLLSVEQELARVRGEIDQLEGRQRFWDNQVAFSTVTVSVQGPRAALAASSGGVWSSLKNSFVEAGDNFVSFTAGLIAVIGWLVPLIVVLAIGLWMIRKLWRLMRRRR